ncbi:hypothetical protein TSUD_107250 [Trifolium subterraneum]|uniref:NADP-dependent oxidoreductase domain-containing protein n=1 Tax=Trifolium subterraneum TaxID=3900 RepID=A0A2Z6P725_TRISU|nr:hypothetical protein TSUD_107250 [Trifolium subterraneum]
MAAAISSHNLFTTFTRINSSKTTKTDSRSRRIHNTRLIRCSDSSTSTTKIENERIKLSNGNDSLEICRVLNGMWQTSGGWGRIDRDDAVEAMLRYADSGLSTFDMADHCM